MAVSSDPMVADAIVIGGGPAGLTAALYLARFRRSVIVVDGGDSRVSKIPRSHNYPGFVDGVPGHTLLETLGAQLERYPVRRVQAYVERIARRDDQSAGGNEAPTSRFQVDWNGGSAVAAQIFLATGLSDNAPDMPYLREALQKGLLRYCPVCDAYEAVGQRIGVYARDEAGIAEAEYLRHFSPHVTVFFESGAAAFGAEDRARMRAAGVDWVEEAVEALEPQATQVSVHHGNGRTVCDTLYCALGVQVHSSLARDLGAETDPQGYLVVDAHQATTAPGLYAAGDVSQGLNQIAVAAGGAAIAASAMHRALGS